MVAQVERRRRGRRRLGVGQLVVRAVAVLEHTQVEAVGGADGRAGGSGVAGPVVVANTQRRSGLRGTVVASRAILVAVGAVQVNTELSLQQALRGSFHHALCRWGGFGG
ncbi:hypothetical protein E2C01_051771 [Portunus trituberculatus]|uniref:Uncharacterized protein n=1 Tax=Portunus trituberculatus TaxID=210409 RepID=A0A5B7GJY8_PORTR|nr:hypothetical protein [Portunus trituberculatus]